jgi:hypothetical protein
MNNIAKQIMAEERELLDAMAVSNRLQRSRLPQPTGCTPCSSCGRLPVSAVQSLTQTQQLLDPDSE